MENNNPPKEEATNLSKALAETRRRAAGGLSAECPRNAQAGPPDPEWKRGRSPKRPLEIGQTGKSVRAQNGTDPRRRQHLLAALNYLDAARLPLLLAVDELEAAGVALEDDPVGTVRDAMVGLRLILSGKADLADIPRDWPAHATQAAIAFRAERARRAGR